jgi:hypothetical protein
MTPSRKIAEHSNTEQHRSKTKTDHAVSKAQRPRPARRGAGEHPKLARTPDRHSEVAAPTAAAPSSAHARSESVSAGNDRLADVAAVLLIVLSGLAMVLFFVALAIGPSM